MSYVSLCFEVHQPLRLKKGFFWDGSSLRSVSGPIEEFYFDSYENRRIFERISSKCYLPANRTILSGIKRFCNSERPFKAAYSLSGIFIEQCSRLRPDVLDSFVELVDTGMVEVLEQTYYHSLSSLYGDDTEFLEQIRMHRELVWDVFAVKPVTFENTELIYNDHVAGIASSLGYRAIFAEGVIANPNHVYRPPGTDIALLLRNYQLTDDIGFRFSSRWWEGYPLTADKYAGWLSSSAGECINLFCDYETFGEHQWEETGIFHFLEHLPGEILAHENLSFAKPCEIARDVPPSREISVSNPVSWADQERDTSCWLGNALQNACHRYLKRLEHPAKESGDTDLLRIWRYLGMSDHLYYIFTWGGGAGEVHSYFSPYGHPYDAAVTYFSVLSDFHYRLKERLHLADSPFLFSVGEDRFTGSQAWSLEGFGAIVEKESIESLEYHALKGDFAAWAKGSLGNLELAEELAEVSGLHGKQLRERLLHTIKLKDWTG